jgi:hypothetical protein
MKKVDIAHFGGLRVSFVRLQTNANLQLFQGIMILPQSRVSLNIEPNKEEALT